jgi:hypothetical protein
MLGAFGSSPDFTFGTQSGAFGGATTTPKPSSSSSKGANKNNNKTKKTTTTLGPYVPTDPIPKDIFEIAKAMAMHYSKVNVSLSSKVSEYNTDPILQIFN